MSLTGDSNVPNKRRRSKMWEHFNKVLGQEKIECLYCGTLICCVSRQGTRLMHHRLVRCKEYPYADVGERQKSASG